MVRARSHRYSLNVQTAYDDGEDYSTGPVRNLSTTGCYIETEAPLPEGRTLRVMPIQTDDSDELCELVGQVARVEKGSGMGIRFLPLSDTAMRRVIKFCEARSPAAQPVPKREITDKLAPGHKVLKEEPELVDDADILPLSRAVDDDHASKLRQSLNSIEGAPVVDEPSHAYSDELPADVALAFPRKSWSWAAAILVGAAVIAAALAVEPLVDAVETRAAAAEQVALEQMKLAKLRNALVDDKLQLAVVAQQAAQVVAPTIALSLEVARLADPALASIVVDVNAPADATGELEVFLGLLESSKSPVRTLNDPGTEGAIKWARVHRSTLDSTKLVVVPGKAGFVGARVIAKSGELEISDAKLAPL